MMFRNLFQKVVKNGRNIFKRWDQKTREITKIETEQRKADILRHDTYNSGTISLHNKSFLARYLARTNVRSFAAELRRRAAWRFMSGNVLGRSPRLGLPLYAFVGLGLATQVQMQQEDRFDSICQEIKGLFQHPGKAEARDSTSDNSANSSGVKLRNYDLGPLIAKGCNGAVYQAKRKINIMNENNIGLNIISQPGMVTEESSDEEDFVAVTADGEVEETSTDGSTNSRSANTGPAWREVLLNPGCHSKLCPATDESFDLAIKMMFNYGVKSTANAITRAMEKEIIPSKMADLNGDMNVWENGNHVKKKRLKPHPNIVAMGQVFVDSVPVIKDAMEEYPSALPERLNPEGLGRNKTLFLVMKKYSCTLREYVVQDVPSVHTSMLMLTQLVEACIHLGSHNMAHRDIKSNNILLNYDSSYQCPHLVLSDFGCCLSDSAWGLRVPFFTDDVNRGGNGCLMAPEIATAKPGPDVYLDYSKSDIWATGAVAYEIFGGRNPFYANSRLEHARVLNSGLYKERDLPSLPAHAPSLMEKVVKLMLQRDPAKRPSAQVVGNMLHLLMWAPQDWFNHNLHPSRVKVIRWILTLTAGVILQRSQQKNGLIPNEEHELKSLFLSRLNLEEVVAAVDLLCGSDQRSG